MSGTTQPRDLDLSAVAQESAEESTTTEQASVGDQPDVGGLVSEDDAQ